MEAISLIRTRRWDAVSGITVVQKGFSSILLSFLPHPRFLWVRMLAHLHCLPPLMLISLFHLSIPSSLRAIFFSSSFRRNVCVMKPLCLYSEPAPVQNWIGCSRHTAAPLPLLPPHVLFAFSIISRFPPTTPHRTATVGILPIVCLNAKVVLLVCSCSSD